VRNLIASSACSSHINVWGILQYRQESTHAYFLNLDEIRG